MEADAGMLVVPLKTSVPFPALNKVIPLTVSDPEIVATSPRLVTSTIAPVSAIAPVNSYPSAPMSMLLADAPEPTEPTPAGAFNETSVISGFGLLAQALKWLPSPTLKFGRLLSVADQTPSPPFHRAALLKAVRCNGIMVTPF